MDKKQTAQQIFKQLCASLDGMKWQYEKDEEKLLIRSGVNIGGVPVRFVFLLRGEIDIIQLICRYPFDIPAERQVDVSMAAVVANFGLIDGSFDYSLTDNKLFFRLSECYRGSEPSAELFEYMINTSASTMNHYANKFKDIAEGRLLFEDFMTEEKKH